MEFIKRMKKREYLEMAIKTITAFLACVLVILLLEGMIYGIQMNALANKGTVSSTQSNVTIAYCVEREEDKYSVIFYNDNMENKWSCSATTFYTKEECEQLEGKSVLKVVFGQPNPFDLTITPVHFVIMVVFIGAVMGYFVYKFTKLSKEYKKVERKFKETGTIDISNF